jgi:hypothetical protein
MVKRARALHDHLTPCAYKLQDLTTLRRVCIGLCTGLNLTIEHGNNTFPVVLCPGMSFFLAGKIAWLCALPQVWRAARAQPRQAQQDGIE